MVLDSRQIIKALAGYMFVICVNMTMSDKTKKLAIFSVLIVAILVISSLPFLFPSNTVKAGGKQGMDDRISPLENQGLILEVKRIRDRGLLNRLMEYGMAWKYQPQFYFIAGMDELEYVSKNVSALGLSSEMMFTRWDTIFQENKVMKDIDEEQETSKVTLVIVERVPKGLLGNKFEDVEREMIFLTYDYRTGRWTGDDFLKDKDGYGHYVGEYFEVWFDLYQTDYDGDGIPYWTEVNILHTDSMVDDSYLDPDNDGITTAWEWKWGYDPHTWDDHVYLDPDVDGIENIEEYKMAKWFADPFSQDIYIEVDGMERGGLFDLPHTFFDESQQALIERFCQHGINVYIDDGWPGDPTNGGGELLPHYDALSQDSGMMLQFYSNHFPDDRKGIFRYLVIGHGGSFVHPSKFDRYDAIHVGNGFDFVIKFFVKQDFTPRTQRLTLAAAVMHEIGHSLGITPWTIEGCDNISYGDSLAAREKYIDEWGGYYSIMNYFYIYDKKLLDYSDGSHGDGDQNDWEKIYLPTFETESSVIEDLYFYPPGVDKVVDEHVKIKLEGWNYSKELTDKYVKDTRSPVEPIKCNWSVYERVGDDHEYPSDRNVRIYVQPMVPFAGWVLMGEGYLNADGDIEVC